MAKKTIGYVKLEWTCPNCSTKNPGPQKTCLSCGSPQPADVVFSKAEQDVLITDENEIEKAKSSPDVHCPYCGTRNAGTTKVCAQCGGDLADAQARKTGQILGAYQDKEKTIVCSSCGTENLSSSSFCYSCGASLALQPASPSQQTPTSVQPSVPEKSKIKPLYIILPVIFLLLICIVIAILSNKKSDVSAEVIDTSWSRSITIQEYGPVSETDWISDIPEGADIGECQSEYHHTSSEPEASSTEICSTAYVEDEGTGYGEVAMDCTYKVYIDKCEYTTNQWYDLTNVSIDGTDKSPEWPATNLSSNQREGTRHEIYTITFENDENTYTYTTGTFSEYTEFNLGSEWILSINAFGKVTDVQPVE